MPLEEGHSYEIKDFELSHAAERVRLTRNRYNINLTNSAVIVKIDPIQHFSFYCFPNWDDLYRGLHHPNNVVIKCVAYGALAHVFNDLWNSIDADIILCVLQCWQINRGQGNLLYIINLLELILYVYLANIFHIS
ncbi:unnamed protein product [Brassica oleracea var. botrytis]